MTVIVTGQSSYAAFVVVGGAAPDPDAGLVGPDDRAAYLVWRLLPDYLRVPNPVWSALVTAAARPLERALEVLDQADPDVSDPSWTVLDLGGGLLIELTDDGDVVVPTTALEDPGDSGSAVVLPLGDYVTPDPFIANAVLVENVVRNITDPSSAPWRWLSWLAAITGVDVAGVPPARLRSWLADPLRHSAGTLAAMLEAVAWYTTAGTEPVVTRPSLWEMTITVPAVAVPDLPALEAGVDRVRPAGLHLTITTS